MRKRFHGVTKRPRLWLAEILVGMALFAGSSVFAAPAPLTLFVATNGNDGFTGLLPSWTSSTNGPLATAGRARDIIRARRASGALGPTAGADVIFRGGSYPLSATFTLDAPDHDTVYSNYSGEKPIFTGGKVISTWSPYAGSILQADVNALGISNYFRQLFFEASPGAPKRQTLARYPNFEPSNQWAGGWAFVAGTPVPKYSTPSNDSKRFLTYSPADAHAWARISEGQVFIFPRYNWWNNILSIQSNNMATRTLTLAAGASYEIRPGDRYFIQNQLEELDAPGEWYLMTNTRPWKLYFYPPAPLAGKAVAAPKIRTLLSMKSNARVIFQGFTFECCEGTAVQINDSTQCQFLANTVRNVGDYSGSGVTVAGGVSNQVNGNDLYEIGRDGISLSGGDFLTLKKAEHQALNNYIHHTGVYSKAGAGIYLSGTGHRVGQNLIHDTPRAAIQYGGNLHTIESNRIRHANLETEDGGAIYCNGRDYLTPRGSVLRGNFVTDTTGFGKKDLQTNWRAPYFAWGLYLDDDSAGLDVIGNTVSRSGRASLHLHNARDTRIMNNVFVEGTTAQLEYTGWKTNSKNWTNFLPAMSSNFALVKNLPIWSSFRGMKLAPSNAALPDGTLMSNNYFMTNVVSYSTKVSNSLFDVLNWNPGHNPTDYNLYYHGGKIPGEFTAGTNLGANLCPNPDFEAGTLGAMPPGWGWSIKPTNSAAFATAAYRHTGSCSLQVDSVLGPSAHPTATNGVICTTNLPATPGVFYRVTAYLAAAAPAQAELGVHSWGGAGGYFWKQSAPITVGTNWQKFETLVRLPAPGESDYRTNMTTLNLRLDFLSVQTYWVDGVTLNEAVTTDEFAQWKSSGSDTHSLVADPLFSNAAADNYRFKTNSPALTNLGFRVIDYSKIGPQSSLRATWPLVEATGVRENPSLYYGVWPLE